MNSSKTSYMVIVLFLVFFTAGCQDLFQEQTPTLEQVPTLTTTQTPTTTPPPTLTALPPVGVLLASDLAPPDLLKKMQDLLSDWIPELGYRFQVRPSLSESDINRDDFRLVVVIPPYPDVGEMVADHPDIQFLTVGIQGLAPSKNLSMIGADGYRLDQQGFIAGYLAAMITPDWRVGVIGYSESDITIAARQAFSTGVVFYCGLCLPSYPPWFEYPLYFELGADADTIAWRTAADYMIHRSVGTVYVVPGAGDDAMLRHLSDADINIISGESPLPDIKDHWAASLSFDLLKTFEDYWPEFSTGTGPQSITVPLQITDVNPELFSPGKQRLVNVILEELLAGNIDLGLETTDNP